MNVDRDQLKAELRRVPPAAWLAALISGASLLYLLDRRRDSDRETPPPPEPAFEALEPAPPSTQVDDLAWISWLRVAAITGVVLIHVCGTAAISSADDTLRHVATALDFFSRWSVPVFVMISGALLLDPARYRGHAHFLRRRALRLIPAVIVWHSVYLAYLVHVQGRAYTGGEIAELVLTGRLYTALYFFWIVIGLAAITPLLVPWVAAASPRARLVSAVALCAIPAFMVATAPLRDVDWRTDVGWAETPVTWFIPYLGYFLLGFALRDVVLTRWKLLLAAFVAVGGCAMLTWHWANVDGFGAELELYMPAEAYYTPTLIAVSASVFLLARAAVRSGGMLAWLGRGRMARIGRLLGDATLGVFAVHLLVRQGMLEIDHLGGNLAAGSIQQLLARIVFVLVVAYVIALIARRIPVVRRVF